MHNSSQEFVLDLHFFSRVPHVIENDVIYAGYFAEEAGGSSRAAYNGNKNV